MSARASTLLRSARPWVFWVSLLVIATVVLHAVRDDLNQAHGTVIYLLLVLGGSIGGGRPLGFSLACAGVFCIDYYFQPPYDLLSVDKPLDGVVLAGFLAAAVVTTQLLTQAREEARRARERADEIERLSAEARHAEALREADAMKDALLAAVSHDLRTPLTTIRALAQDVAQGGDDAHRHGAMIAEQAERLSRIVGDLLDLSRLNAGGFSLVPELNTAEDLAGAVVRQFAGVAGCDRLRTVIDYGQPALLGTFDFVQSLRILSNLVDNALRYTPSPGPVTLSVSCTSDVLLFTVEDAGPGIAEPDRAGLFLPFYRSSGTPVGAKGAGLGLSIARRLAQAQGGDVAYMPRPGGGSVFTVSLPRVLSEILAES